MARLSGAVGRLTNTFEYNNWHVEYRYGVSKILRFHFIIRVRQKYKGYYSGYEKFNY